MTDFSAYVFYVNRPDLLKRAVESFPNLWTRLTVIDNSGYGIDVDLPESVERYYPPVPFTYSQSMNWMLKDAEKFKDEFIIHFHSDMYTENPLASIELLDEVRAYNSHGRKWACAWTHYDLLWAINPVALRAIGGWDDSGIFPTYFGDNDFRRRATLAGWECIDTHIQGVKHEGSATIRSDHRLEFLNSQTFPHHAQLYQQKWGGSPGRETYTKPFNGMMG